MLLFSELAKLMQVEMHNMLVCTLYIVSAILCRKYVQPRVRPRFFDQVGHETMHAFSKDCFISTDTTSY